MDNKLQELTDKIHNEIISRAKQEADQIRGEAEKNAAEIITRARSEAESILSDTKKKVSEEKSNMISELKLSSRQAINSLKMEIAELIQSRLIKDSAGKSFQDQGFMNEVMLALVRSWSPDTNNIDLSAILPAGKQKEVENYFKSGAGELLDKGLTLKFSDNIETGFEIGPGDGSYTISFSESDFESFMKEFLRPRMSSLLFGEGDA